MEDKNQDLIKRLKKLLLKGDLELVFSLFFEYLNKVETELSNEVFLLKQQYIRLKKDNIKGILTHENYQTSINKINDSILYLINQISDLKISNKNKKTDDLNQGKILHDIPGNMPRNISTKCIVRIARNEEILLKKFNITPNTILEDIPISKIMEVELIDFSEQVNFEIRRLNSNEQTIDDNELTQWIFFVKPLRTGVYTLFLKVSVIRYIRNKERKKEIVLERRINVVSDVDQLPTKEKDTKWQETNIYINSSEKREAPFNIRNSLRKTIKILGFSFSISGLLLMVTIVSAMALTTYIVYNKIKNKDTVSDQNQVENNNLNTSIETVNPTLVYSNLQKEEINSVVIDTDSQKIESPLEKEETENLKNDLNEPKINENDKVVLDTSSTKNEENRIVIKQTSDLEDFLKETKKLGYSLIDEIVQQDTVKIGGNILIKVTTSGFKPNSIEFFVNKKYNIQPRMKDGPDYYFEIKSTNKVFSFLLLDMDSGNSIEQYLQGNSNYFWTVKRRAVSGW